MSISSRLPAIALALSLSFAPLAAITAQAQTAPVAQSAEPAAAVASPVAPPVIPVAEKETVDNPYGLDALWKGGDFVARGTLLILVLMSMGSWYVLVTKLFEQTRLLSQARKVEREFWKASDVQTATEQLKKGTAFRFLAGAGLEAIEKHEGLLGKIDMNEWVASSIQDGVDNVQSRLQEGLALLGTVGSTGPFVGLFGTVWGIYHALTAIGIAGQASIDKVAGPVGEALIMTAIGLAVAVPAVLGYNLLVRRNKKCMESVRQFGKRLHFILLSTAKA